MRDDVDSVWLRAKPGTDPFEALKAVAAEAFGFDIDDDGHLAEHRHRWSVDCSRVHRRHVADGYVLASCDCGFTVMGGAAWQHADLPAFEQWVDPTGLQRQFIAATGLGCGTPTG